MKSPKPVKAWASFTAHGDFERNEDGTIRLWKTRNASPYHPSWMLRVSIFAMPPKRKGRRK